MSAFAERLRVRSARTPVYNDNDSDDDDFVLKKARTLENVEEIIKRSDAKENACQTCGEKMNLISCCTCTYGFHAKCLVPPLKGPAPDDWRCPECVSPLSQIDKILDCEMRPAVSNDDQDKIEPKKVNHYLLKWKGLSYLHCSWVSEQEFEKAYKSTPRLKTRVNTFHRRRGLEDNDEDDFVAIRPEWTTVDRVIACRGEDGEKEYLVKFVELPYDECYWESESDISIFQNKIQRFNDINSLSRKANHVKGKTKRKEFQQFDHSPEFLKGSLHQYQLEGLNFLRFSWSKQTHVILADEMGLGKTIQSIAHLASLYEENLTPHLVVAPLSTLRNWEREFSTWAPHMNVVMYFGSSQARAVIREHEFYFQEGHKIIQKNQSGHRIRGVSKQNRIKFDVLLTSFEMINQDTHVLKPIMWESLIVDEGHRLKNKDSKLFSSLKQYASYHRVILTGTPLQNNLDELFMLMHFLDAGKFGSLEEFQEEFKDINQEEQISRLHKMLAPHLLRRLKKDVLTGMPPKKELILRVDLSIQQKEYYKAILNRNYQLLTKKSGVHINLSNVMMELRKLCSHPYTLEGVEPETEDPNEAFKQILESSGKMQLLDKMMDKLKEQGHRVLIYTQFQSMLDILEDYCTHKKWVYERLDGRVGGAERQIRIDRFNANNSNRFCFLLSTRAGGLGINLATADTVIIYDSDWNPHADLQAMARAHRLGQTNKVMIYRLINRNTIEERMMQITKKKMVLEHLVVGKLKTKSLKQEELDDILRYGSKELFADENEEAGKAGKIHYDDDAIHKLLDRDQLDTEEASMDDEEENGFLKTFKVANFEYIEENEGGAEEAHTETEPATVQSDRVGYWEGLLKGKHEMHQTEELNALGRSKRVRTKLVNLEDDDLAGLENEGSDGEDKSYEAKSSDDDDDDDDGEDEEEEKAPQGNISGRRPYKRRTIVRNSEPSPLMESEGQSLKVLGFNQSQRTNFLQTVMRYGIGNCDWKHFVPRLRHKSIDEIQEYGMLFLKHLIEDTDESNPTFSDGVPKEGLNIDAVLLRIAFMILVQEKVKYVEEHPTEPLFRDGVIETFPELMAGNFWKEEHDRLLLRAVLKHGYGRWQAIVVDDEIWLQEDISRELHLTYASFSALAEAVREEPMDPNSDPREIEERQQRWSKIYKDMQKKLAEFVRQRVLLLEDALSWELYGATSPALMHNEERETGERHIGIDEFFSNDPDLKAELLEFAKGPDETFSPFDDKARALLETFMCNIPEGSGLTQRWPDMKSIVDHINKPSTGPST